LIVPLWLHHKNDTYIATQVCYQTSCDCKLPCFWGGGGGGGIFFLGVWGFFLKD